MINKLPEFYSIAKPLVIEKQNLQFSDMNLQEFDYHFNPMIS